MSDQSSQEDPQGAAPSFWLIPARVTMLAALVLMTAVYIRGVTLLGSFVGPIEIVLFARPVDIPGVVIGFFLMTPIVVLVGLSADIHKEVDAL